MRRRNTRRGFTLVEILAVLALILILGTVLIPSTSALFGNSRQKAAADVVRARLADARALAGETGKPYRIAVSEDKTRIRVAPDGPEFASAAASNQPSVTAKAIEVTLEKATAEVEDDGDGDPPAVADGYTTLATFYPDGTCKEPRALVKILEDPHPPLRIEVRGVTGGTRVLPQQNQGGAK